MLRQLPSAALTRCARCWQECPYECEAGWSGANCSEACEPGSHIAWPWSCPTQPLHAARDCDLTVDYAGQTECWKYFAEPAISFAMAEASCVEWGGHLISVHSNAMLERLRSRHYGRNS